VKFAYLHAPETWKRLLRRTYEEILDDHCFGLAAQRAFYFLLALFPALLFLVALVSVLPIEHVLDEWFVANHFAPNRESEWVWITPGSLLATGLWLCAALGFKLYVRNFADFNATYGTIGGAIMLLLWFYLLGLAILIGAELNGEVDRENREQARRHAPQDSSVERRTTARISGLSERRPASTE
jgi:uncharacterized BrkB/YihY/UPF0761 family membrane protein